MLSETLRTMDVRDIMESLLADDENHLTAKIYIGKPNDCGIADFARIDGKKINQLMRDAASDSNSIGDYIFELLSGGEDEVGYLLNYLEK